MSLGFLVLDPNRRVCQVKKVTLLANSGLIRYIPDTGSELFTTRSYAQCVCKLWSAGASRGSLFGMEPSDPPCLRLNPPTHTIKLIKSISTLVLGVPPKDYYSNQS